MDGMREFRPGTLPSADLDVGDTFVLENKTWRVRSLSGRVGSAGWATAVHVTTPPAAPQALRHEPSLLLGGPDVQDENFSAPTGGLKTVPIGQGAEAHRDPQPDQKERTRSICETVETDFGSCMAALLARDPWPPPPN